MVKNKGSLFGIIALVIGASGLGLGAFSIVNFQTIEGPQGPPGQDGEDGIDGTNGTDGINGTDGTDGVNGTDGQDLVGLQVGILDPDQNEIVSGLVSVRILLWNSSQCTLEVLINGSVQVTYAPWVWNTTEVMDGWYNVSVRVTDAESNTSQDEVLVHVINHPPLHTIEFYFFENVVSPSWFFNITYNITDITVFLVTVSSNGSTSDYPIIYVYKDSVNYISDKIQNCGTVGGIFINGIYEFKFYTNTGIQDFYITIELTQV